MQKTKFKKAYILFLTAIVLAFGFIFLRFFHIDERIPEIKRKQIISTVILSHLDSVDAKRVEVLKKISDQESPQTIILVAPNHFDAGKTDIITTEKEWKLSNAVVLPNKNIINKLLSNQSVSSDEGAISSEHGITNLLGNINQNFPDAELVPIIIKRGASKDEMTALSNELIKACGQNCLLIASVDFSQYQPGALAEIHDSLSIRALSNLDEGLIWQTEVDSPQSLALAILWAKNNQTESFHVEENNNSAKVANDPDVESTSYILGWYESGLKKIVTEEMTFMMAGDSMFGRLVDYQFKNDLQESMKNLGERFFWGVDFSILNLEGPISQIPTRPSTNPYNLIFNFPPETVEVLKWLHINAVSLANNHSLNQGVSGFENTKAVLSQNNITPIGHQSEFDDSSIIKFENGKKKIIVIAANFYGINPDLGETIVQEKQNGAFVIIFPHWGNEYQKVHSNNQERLAHAWIDAGADLVIGSHPHVIQDAENYNGKPIFYSLGNLIFDQTFSTETQQGLVIAGKIDDNKLTLVFLPTIQKNLQPELMEGEERRAEINRLKEGLGLDTNQTGYGYDTIEISF